MKFEYLKKDLAHELQEEQTKYVKAFDTKAFDEVIYIMQKIQKIQNALLEMVDTRVLGSKRIGLDDCEERSANNSGLSFSQYSWLHKQNKTICMKLQDFISMLTSQLKEEEICHENAIKNKKFFQAHKIMQRITSLTTAINKTTAHSNENMYVSQVKFQLLGINIFVGSLVIKSSPHWLMYLAGYAFPEHTKPLPGKGFILLYVALYECRNTQRPYWITTFSYVRAFVTINSLCFNLLYNMYRQSEDNSKGFVYSVVCGYLPHRNHFV